jgi:hypothetical protein
VLPACNSNFSSSTSVRCKSDIRFSEKRIPVVRDGTTAATCVICIGFVNVRAVRNLVMYVSVVDRRLGHGSESGCGDESQLGLALLHNS